MKTEVVIAISFTGEVQ